MSRINMTVKPGATFNRRRVSEFIIGLDKPLQHWFFQLWGEVWSGRGCEFAPVILNNSLDGCSKNDLLLALDLFADPECPRTEFCRLAVAFDLDPEDPQAGKLPARCREAVAS